MYVWPLYSQIETSWHSVWLFQVRIEIRRHEVRGPSSLLLDLLDLRQRFGTLTPCLLIADVFRCTGAKTSVDS